MRILSRSDWGAKPRKRKYTQRRTATMVFIHHGGTKLAGHTRDHEAAALRAYQQYHMGTRGWSDIAYSFAVAPRSGRVYELRGWGAKPGATKGYNHLSYAIVIIGDTGQQKVSKECVDSVHALIRLGQSLGHITPDANVRGHRDVKPTACPGDSAYTAIVEKQPVPVEHSSPPPPYRKALRLRRPRMRGKVVKWVQSQVGAKADGVFGPNTKRAVVAWQRKNRLVPDGIVGPKTYKAMASQ